MHYSFFFEKMFFSHINPLVPSVHFLDVFPLFHTKRRCSSQRIFSMKLSKWPRSIFLSSGANLKFIEKKADLWGAKNWRPIWPKKNFFWLFNAETTLKCFSKRKKIFENFFLKKIFLEIFSKFYFRVGQSVHKCNVWECDLQINSLSKKSLSSPKRWGLLFTKFWNQPIW